MGPSSCTHAHLCTQNDAPQLDDDGDDDDDAELHGNTIIRVGRLQPDVLRQLMDPEMVAAWTREVCGTHIHIMTSYMTDT